MAPPPTATRLPTTRRRGHEAESLPSVEARLISTCASAAAAASAAPDVAADHPPIAPRRAAVLVALFEEEAKPPASSSSSAAAAAAASIAAADVRVWLTRRADHLSAHAGEVCLPGGKRDPHDASDAACALREAEEELGLPRDRARVLCALPPLLSKHRLSVHPVVAVVPRDFRPRPNPDEVAEAFSMPLSAFLERRNHLHWDFEGEAEEEKGGGGEDEASTAPPSKRPRSDEPATRGPKLRMHSFSTVDGKQVVWGLTAEVLVRVARLAYGRPPEFDLLAKSAAVARRRGGTGAGGAIGTDYSRLWSPDGRRARADRQGGGGGWDGLLAVAEGREAAAAGGGG